MCVQLIKMQKGWLQEVLSSRAVEDTDASRGVDPAGLDCSRRGYFGRREQRRMAL